MVQYVPVRGIAQHQTRATVNWDMMELIVHPAFVLELCQMTIQLALVMETAQHRTLVNVNKDTMEVIVL